MGASYSRLVLEPGPHHIMFNIGHSLHLVGGARSGANLWPTLQHALIRCQGGGFIKGILTAKPSPPLGAINNLLVPGVVWWLLHFSPGDIVYKLWSVPIIKAFWAALEATHKTRTICSGCVDAKATFGNWIAMILVGGLAGAGGTFILEGAIFPGSTNIGVNVGWGTVTCLSVSTTFTLLVNILGVDPKTARTLLHFMNVIHWSSKAYGSEINMYAWLHWIQNKVAPYSQLKNKDKVLTKEQFDSIDFIPKLRKPCNAIHATPQ